MIVTVSRLKRGLYGLKQSRRLWYEGLGKCLENIGFKHLQSDSGIYIWTNDSTKVIIPVFMDDLTLVSDSKEELNQIKKLLEVFKLKNLCPITNLLGIEINYNQKDQTMVHGCEYRFAILHIKSFKYLLNILLL